MTSYQNLDWNSLNFVKNHLYRRLANPLNHALGRLLIAEHIVTDDHARQQFQQVMRNLEIALNLVKAWSALVHVQSGGRLTPGQRRYLGTDKLPAWIVDHLKLQTDVQIVFKRRIYAHPETFYEALVMMTQLAAAIGTPTALRLEDAPDSGGVWVRAMFTAPAEGAYAGFTGLAQRLDPKNPTTRDILTQVLVLRALLALNGAELRMQTNEQTGAQAIAVRMPTSSSEQVAVSPELPQAILDALQGMPVSGLAQAVASALPVDESETLIIPPPGFRDRLAKITADAQAAASEGADTGKPDAPAMQLKVPPEIENKTDTQPVPPEDRESRLAEAQYAVGPIPPQPASTESGDAEVENRSETLMLPPTDREARLAEAAQPAESAAPEVENRSETLMLPPTDREARFNEAAQPAAESAAPEVENRSETLMLPPTDREARLAEAAQLATPDSTEDSALSPSGDFIERVVLGDEDTQNVPPPSLRTELLWLRDLGAQDPAPPPFPESQASDAADTAGASVTDPAVSDSEKTQEAPQGVDERAVAEKDTGEHQPPSEADQVDPAADVVAHTAETKSDARHVPPAGAETRHAREHTISAVDAEGTDDAPGAPPDREQGPDAPADTSVPNAHTNG